MYRFSLPLSTIFSNTGHRWIKPHHHNAISMTVHFVFRLLCSTHFSYFFSTISSYNCYRRISLSVLWRRQERVSSLGMDYIFEIEKDFCRTNFSRNTLPLLENSACYLKCVNNHYFFSRSY